MHLPDFPPLLAAATTVPEWLTAVLLGVIEGITEFLPVSSTGHLLIAEHWLPRQTELFNIVIQSGAVLAVVPLFKDRFRQFLTQPREPATQAYFLKILLAFALTAVGGVLMKHAGLKLPEQPLPVAVALLLGGVAFLAVEAWLRGRALTAEVTWAVAAAVGAAQLLAAAFPGTSRSGASILVALALGMGRPAATEFSFLVGIPTMLAAGAYSIYKALHHPPPDAPVENWPMVLLSFLVAAAVSFVVVKWLLRYVQSHTFTAFGWYRIAAGILLLVLFLT